MKVGDCIKMPKPGNKFPHCWFVVSDKPDGQCVIVNMVSGGGNGITEMIHQATEAMRQTISRVTSRDSIRHLTADWIPMQKGLTEQKETPPVGTRGVSRGCGVPVVFTRHRLTNGKEVNGTSASL